MWTQANSETVWPWFSPFFPNANEGRTTQVYGQNGEDGVDIHLPLHTPITSLTLGTVISTGWYGGGGVVCVASYLDGIGLASVYYQHLDTIEVAKNDVLHVGDLVGLSGGQLYGGFHPVTCCSTGAHVEIGINPPAGGIWKKLGPSMDPRPWLLNLQANGPPARDLAGGIAPGSGGGGPPPNPVGNLIALSDVLVAGTGPVSDTFLGIEQRLDFSMAFIPIDWSTISHGTHWWDYVFPWQWQQTQNTLQNNLAQAVAHDIQAFFIRLLVVGFGISLILLVFAAIIVTAIKASGADKMLTQAATEAAVGAAV